MGRSFFLTISRVWPSGATSAASRLSTGVLADMRTQEGMQQAPAYPALGLALAAGSESGAPLAALPVAAHVTPAEAADGVVLE